VVIMNPLTELADIAALCDEVVGRATR
jgi:hypothetical protein